MVVFSLVVDFYIGGGGAKAFQGGKTVGIGVGDGVA